MNSATSFPRIMGLALAFAAGAGGTYWMTKSPEGIAGQAKAEKLARDRVTKVEHVESLPSSKVADTRPPGVAVRDLLHSSIPMRHRFEREGWDLAGTGVESAMSRMAQIEDIQQRTSFISGMFEQWALSQKPEVSIALLKMIPEGLDREMAMLALRKGWRRGPEILRISNDLGIAGTLGMYMLKHLSKDVSPQEVATFTRDFMKGGPRGVMLAEIAAKLARTDPAAAFALGNELTGQQQMAFMRRFADGWAAEDAEAAMKWAATVPDLVTRAELQASIIESQAERDAMGAARHAQQLPADTPGRVEILQAVAREWAAKDTRAAVKWADTLTDEAERGAAQMGIRASAPVGIGVALGTAQGLPVINALTNDGAAKRAGTLQQGDRILAVSDGTGQWVDASQVDLSEIVGLIRGEAGTAVSLRIQPADGTSARVITLTRQQIIAKPTDNG